MSRAKHHMSRQKRLRPLAGLLALGLVTPAFAGESEPFPTYKTGPQADGSWIVGTGQIVKPAGIQVNLGNHVRAKAIALNPDPASHTAAVLTMGANQAVEVFNTTTGTVLQNYLPSQDPSGSYGGISYSPDGKYLLFSQDSSYIAMAKVSPQGLLSDYARINVPADNSFIKCFPNSPTGAYGRPCGTFYSTWTSYPGGVAFSKDGKSAYALLNQNNTLVNIDLTARPLKQGKQIRVGNAPHSILIHGNTAYISNEGGRAAERSDFQMYSAGTPIVSSKTTGASTTGTISVVNLENMQVINTITDGIGLHPTGMAAFGDALLVSNTYSDTISVIDMPTRKVMRTIKVGTPIAAPGQGERAYGTAPTEIAVDRQAGIAYVALYNANAIAVVDLSGGATKPVMGMIPVAFAPGSVKLDKANKQLIVANDKGIGTRFSFEEHYGVVGYNTHQDNGTVSIIKVPSATELAAMTRQVYLYNHWDLKENIMSAGGGSPTVPPVALPAKIGDPSLIKHVFLIIRENRTYDQVHGDDPAGNGDPELAVFGRRVTPNMHAITRRFPLLDNFYTPSRQSADGHQWIVEAMAPYADDIQSPDWIRSYPGGNAGDGLAYIKKGNLFSSAVAAGLKVKIYGEYGENETFPTSLGHPSWLAFYYDALKFEAGQQKTLKYQDATLVTSELPVVSKHLVKNFPMYDLNIPDQFRVDIWLQDFRNDLKAGTVPALSIIWIPNDHTGGPPSARAQVADNDLAVGRIIDEISHSRVWSSSAIFVEEDDAQDGVDHVDGHRCPAYIISPYAVQNGPTDRTYYTQMSMTRTIEQILGLPPMNHYDLVASPMRTAFVTGTPPQSNFRPFDHLRNLIPLDEGVTPPRVGQASEMELAWRELKTEMFKNKTTKPDSVDRDTLNHLTWYEATEFKRPYPGESEVRWPSRFKDRLRHPSVDADEDE